MRKDKVIYDLFVLLFQTDFTCDPDRWDLNMAMARTLLTYVHLHFKDKQEIDGSHYWGTYDVEDHFFDTVCPGIKPTLAGFTHICEAYMDFALWEQCLNHGII